MEERSFDEVVDATCPSCRRAVPLDANVCPKCGYRLKAEAGKITQFAPGATSMPASAGTRTSKSVIGGILVMISGLIGIIEGVWIASATEEFADYFREMMGDVFPGIEGVFLVCGGIFMVIGLVALIGGLFAFRKRHWGIAIVGGIFSLFTLGIVFFEGSILGLIGLILIAISKREFS